MEDDQAPAVEDDSFVVEFDSFDSFD